MEPSSNPASIDAQVADILCSLSDWDVEIYTRYGKAVSDRMAIERQDRQDRKEASLDILEEWRARGYNRPQPSFEQLQARRYGPEWRKVVSRARGLEL